MRAQSRNPVDEILKHRFILDAATARSMTGGGFRLVLNRPAILFSPSSVPFLSGVKGQGEGESSLPAWHISKGSSDESIGSVFGEFSRTAELAERPCAKINDLRHYLIY